MNVSSLELLRETGQGQDASDTGGKLGEGGGHRSAREMGEDGQMERACGCCASGGWRREKELKMIELYVRRTRRFERRRSEETVV